MPAQPAPGEVAVFDAVVRSNRRVSERTLRRWIADGKLKPRYDRRRAFLNVAELEALGVPLDEPVSA